MTKPVLAKNKSSFARLYTHPVTGEEVPSVTTVTGRKDKSGPLVGWAVKTTAEYAVTHWDALAPLPKASKLKLIKGARYELHVPGTDHTAAQVGDIVHEYVEYHVKGHTPQTFARGTEDWFRQYLAFERDWEPELLFAEATLWNRTLGYAGTADLAMRIGGLNFLIDIKTGNGVYPEYACQLQALAHGEFVLTPDGGEKEPPRWDRLAILHLRPEFWEIHQVVPDSSAWGVFQRDLLSLRAELSNNQWLGTRVKGAAEDEQAA